MSSSWDSEDVIEFFECALLSLWQPKEDHDESDDVESSIEADRTLRRER